MITSKPCTYAKVTQAAAATVKATRGEFYGVLVISSTNGVVTVKDGGASGTTVYVSGTLSAGQVIVFGGCGVLCDNDIYVSIANTAEVTVLYI